MRRTQDQNPPKAKTLDGLGSSTDRDMARGQEEKATVSRLQYAAQTQVATGASARSARKEATRSKTGKSPLRPLVQLAHAQFLDLSGESSHNSGLGSNQ